jgi:hypothetical protein
VVERSLPSVVRAQDVSYQIREIIKRNEEKEEKNNDAIANKKKELSLSSKAYKLYYEGMSAV